MTITYNALSGALAAQAAINTVSQNIANSKTAGYTRQGVLLQSNAASGDNSPGNGVIVGSLLRFSDSYKSQQMWRSNSELGKLSQVQPYLTQLEKVMNDPTSSISYGFDNFFKSLNAAAVDPTSTPLRQQVITSADSMSKQINSIYNLTSTQMVSSQQQSSTMLPALNESLASIAALNAKISSVGATGTSTSALIDQRDQLIDSVASQVSVEVVYSADGSANLSLKTGQPLVASDISAKLAYEAPGGVQTLTLAFANTKFRLDDTKVGGKLGGLADFRANTLKPLQESIVDIASAFSTNFNNVLKGGSKSDGTDGTALFVLNASSTTSLLSIDPGFTTADLAFAAHGEPAGDNTNLQALIGVQTTAINVGSLGSVLLNDADTQLVGKLAIQSQQNQAQMKTATTIRQQAEDDWKSTSAVNVDEEGINLIEFQNMYQANMKVISVANSLFEATLQMFN
ncbi:flagellar hook-associated protein FlgK [Duganella phyllosphaerae]|uniref:Flagellar hook-associated protein 1 n=1 Tax=Duganella phyllosphaerae TaxID=762836 RepID=A0A1E7X5H9_9BURK|nr:flagellar hook-associated protein FlgK [Duganella phyllosphaerae]OFA08030.1 flagellar hook-associated protein 1 [Duganella phyllosphaerae]